MIAIIKTYNFRLYPNKTQESNLSKLLDMARLAYNKQLELKIKTYKEKNINLTQFDLNNNLLKLKQENPFLYDIHSQALQNINQRISYAFNNFYRRVKNKENPGFPRFKGKNRYDSITFPQSGFSLSNKLYISKMGNISIVQHREIKGKIKTMTIKRTLSGKWFAVFCAEQQDNLEKSSANKLIGIDVGLYHFYANSNGNLIENPRCLRKSEDKLAKIQRMHSRKKKGSKNRNKSRIKIAGIYEKITNQRKDFLHKESRKLANLSNNIAVEKLSISNMVKNKYLSKSIADASWQRFIQMLSYKVEETGGKLIEVNAKGTSQYCICGNKVEKTLAVRIHRCTKCNIEIDRDVMSAMIIKQLAIKGTTAGSAESNAWGDVSREMPMNQESQCI